MSTKKPLAEDTTVEALNAGLFSIRQIDAAGNPTNVADALLAVARALDNQTKATTRADENLSERLGGLREDVQALTAEIRQMRGRA